MNTGIFQQNMSKLIRRTVIDEDFRKLALSSPLDAYEQISGHPPPCELCFFEEGTQAAANNHWILPPFLRRTWLG